MSANYKKLEGNVSHGWDFANAMIMVILLYLVTKFTMRYLSRLRILRSIRNNDYLFEKFSNSTGWPMHITKVSKSNTNGA